MYKNNWIKRGAVAAVAAGLMLGALPGVAMATTITQETTFTEKVDGKPDVTAKATDDLIKKDYTAPISYKGSISFHVAFDKAVPQGSNTPTDMKGKAWDVTVGDKDKVWTAGSGIEGSASIYDVFKDVNFDAPGQYEFTVTENKINNNNLAENNQSFTVVVNVTWQDNYPATNGINTPVIRSVRVKDATKGKVADMTFTNSGVTDAGELKFKKEVAGTAANTDEQFSFQFKIGGKAQGDYAFIVKDDKGVVQTGSDRIVTADSADYETVQLKHGWTVEIPNLPDGTTWEVGEPKNNGYTTSAKAGSEEDMAPEAGEVVFQTGKDAEKNTLKGSIKKAEGAKAGDKDSVVIVNEKGYLPNTGITANSLPFVGVAAVAAAGAVTLVISRKRRAGEEF